MKNSFGKAEPLIAILAGIAAYFVLVSVDAFDWMIDITRAHEEWELDEIILALWVALIFGLLITLRRLHLDISRRKKLTQNLGKAMAQAEKLSQMKSDFLSMVSHELRTPLTAIIGFAKLTRKNLKLVADQGQCEEEASIRLGRIEDNTNIIISEGDRLSELVSNVLDLAKIESGHFEWHFARTSMKDVVKQSIDATRVLFSEKGLSLVSEVSAGLPTITGDSDRLVQVCINLLSNASKFTRTGQVRCKAVVEEGQIIVRVEDTGIGVPDADVEVIFDKFRQLGNTLTDKPKGTGLGLPICKEIVEHHGGKIWYERNQTGGSTFVFSLPIHNDLV